MKEKMKVKKKKKMCSISNVADVQRYQWSNIVTLQICNVTNGTSIGNVAHLQRY
jgi:hypothetical protein